MSVCFMRKPPDGDEDDVEIPDVILSARRYYRLRYFGISTFLMLLVYSVPRTDLYATTVPPTGSLRSVLLSCLVFVAYAVASVSFFLVQGSDPGYLSVDVTVPVMDDEENPKHDHEQQTLLSEECIESTTNNTNDDNNQIPLLQRHHSEYRPGGPSCELEVESTTTTTTAPRHRLRHTHSNKIWPNESLGTDANNHNHHLPGNGEGNHHTIYCQWSVISCHSNHNPTLSLINRTPTLII